MTSGLSSTLRIAAVGDIMLGDEHVTIGWGVRSKLREKEPHWLFQHVGAALRGADICFGNLEAPLSMDIGNKPKDLCFVGDASAVACLKEAGFNLLSVANNHIMEHGATIYRETLDILDACGIDYCGYKASNPTILRVDDWKLAFFGYSFVDPVLNGELFARGSYASMLQEIREFAKWTDLILVSLHWGMEYMEYPSYSQVQFARKLVQNGAHIILGHHPHVVQGVERYRDGLIAYSLGNFVFDMLWSEETRRSFILKIEVPKSGKIDYEIVPVRINDQYQPEIVKGDSGGQFLEHVPALRSLIPETDMAELAAHGNSYDLQARNAALKQSRRMQSYLIKRFWKLRLPSIVLIAKRQLGKAVRRLSGGLQWVFIL